MPLQTPTRQNKSCIGLPSFRLSRFTVSIALVVHMHSHAWPLSKCNLPKPTSPCIAYPLAHHQDNPGYHLSKAAAMPLRSKTPPVTQLPK
ncbi:uncharacterized protein EI97DRAFT_434943 [Westerdykella ornata]|uniref:Uncharacterized protein n=1 Tax=Westerdykella ornata TaxID=318751 RepID=A0A6A6JGG3_WESOR|nr:uncharacterized protein EI97DRAFT_434943 [Westerdykella ornata]KAF2274716.1 hypothetical protein EI97DRAFT_434943 [Westerdykella ornata]